MSSPSTFTKHELVDSASPPSGKRTKRVDVGGKKDQDKTLRRQQRMERNRREHFPLLSMLCIDTSQRPRSFPATARRLRRLTSRLA
jgi:hypothetical protein